MKSESPPPFVCKCGISYLKLHLFFFDTVLTDPVVSSMQEWLYPDYLLHFIQIHNIGIFQPFFNC